MGAAAGVQVTRFALCGREVLAQVDVRCATKDAACFAGMPAVSRSVDRGRWHPAVGMIVSGPAGALAPPVLVDASAGAATAVPTDPAGGAGAGAGALLGAAKEPWNVCASRGGRKRGPDGAPPCSGRWLKPGTVAKRLPGDSTGGDSGVCTAWTVEGETGRLTIRPLGTGCTSRLTGGAEATVDEPERAGLLWGVPWASEEARLSSIFACRSASLASRISENKKKTTGQQSTYCVESKAKGGEKSLLY